MTHYAVLHVSKGKGQSSGLSKHIERETTPENADPEKAHLNLKEDFSHLGKTLGERADTVIKNHGVKRKVQADAVKYCPIILSGSHDRMKEIEELDCIDEWYQDNKKFIEDRYGKENIISFAMHRDEKTPHIHAVIVPVIKDKDKKGNERTRLSARDVFNKTELKQVQTDYANHLKDYGLERGREGSTAQHTTVQQFYKKLPAMISEKEKEVAAQQEKLNEMKLQYAQYSIGKGIKKAVQGVGTGIAEGLTKGRSERVALEAEVQKLTQDNQDLKKSMEKLTALIPENSALRKQNEQITTKMNEYTHGLVKIFNKMLAEEKINLKVGIENKQLTYWEVNRDQDLKNNQDKSLERGL